MSRRTATTRVEGDSLLLGRSNYRDADLILTLFSQELGRVSALARGARKSTKRFSGSLEPKLRALPGTAHCGISTASYVDPLCT